MRTSLTAETLDAGATVKAYKQLASAQRAFRSLKTVDIEVAAARAPKDKG